MSTTRWVALHCGEEAETLLARHPNAFLLLCQIAMRARWKDCPITGLQAGEAFIGDWKQSGLNSEMAYRCAKTTLQKCRLATFRGTNKGTRARLAGSSIFSLTATPNNGQNNALPNGPTNTLAADQQQAGNEPATTIHPEHKEHPETLTPFSEGKSSQPDFHLPEEKEASPEGPELVTIVEAYPRRQDIAAALEHLRTSVRKGAHPEVVLAGTRAIAAVIQQLPSGAMNAYVPSASTFFRNERWRDDPRTWLRAGAAKNGGAHKPLDLGGRREAETIY